MEAAGLRLYLQANGEGAAADAAAREQGLFRRADACIGECLAGVSAALAALGAATDATLAAQQDPAMPAAQDRPLLSEALSRVLHLPGVKHIFSWQQVTAEPAPAVEDAEVEEADLGGGAVGSAAALQRAQQAVGLGAALLPAGASVPAALRTALRAARAAEAERLVPLPPWLRMPSRLQQHWLQFSLAGVGLGYGALFVYRHSALSGSDDIDRWLKGGAAAVRSAWGEHVVRPLTALSDELFNTFRR